MNWIDDYRATRMSAADAVALIHSGDRVYYAGNAAIPQALVRALAGRRDELHADRQAFRTNPTGKRASRQPEHARKAQEIGMAIARMARIVAIAL